MRFSALARLRPFDFLLLAAALLVTTLSAVTAYGGKGKSESVVIEGSGHTWIFPLRSEETVHVPGPLGETLVVIHAGSASIVDSPCPNKTCVAAGAIRENGQWVACLPNRVFVRIEGKNHDDKVDGITW